MAYPICRSRNPRASRPASGRRAATRRRRASAWSADKGYESVIEALPDVVAAVPDAVYVILGRPIPSSADRRANADRTSLEYAGSDLGMAEHVAFVIVFVSQHELSRWLEAADVFGTPYPNLDQIVSARSPTPWRLARHRSPPRTCTPPDTPRTARFGWFNDSDLKP